MAEGWFYVNLLTGIAVINYDRIEESETKFHFLLLNLLGKTLILSDLNFTLLSYSWPQTLEWLGLVVHCIRLRGLVLNYKIPTPSVRKAISRKD